MAQNLIKWTIVGLLAGFWVALYGLAARHADQGIVIIFSILGAARYCKCAQHGEEKQHG